MPVGSLLTVLGFLLGRPRAVGTSNILFLLGFGLNLVVILLGAFGCSFEVDAIDENAFYVVHCSI